MSLTIGGAVTKMGDSSGYTQAGTVVYGDLAQASDRLLSQGLVTLAWVSAGRLRRVCITRAGRDLHTALVSGDPGAITTTRMTAGPVPTDLADDTAYQCDNDSPGHRHVIDSDQNPDTRPGRDFSDFDPGV